LFFLWFCHWAPRSLSLQFRGHIIRPGAGCRMPGTLWVRLPLLCVAVLWEGALLPPPRRPHTPCHCDCGPGLSGPGAHGQRRRSCHPRWAPRRRWWGNTVPAPLPALTREAFLSRWGHRDALCSWPTADARPLFHLTLVHPAPVPSEGRGGLRAENGSGRGGGRPAGEREGERERWGGREGV
jgi:hypothetical protein